MNADERDKSIIRHIASYCEQIGETVAYFGEDYAVFAGNTIYQNAVSMCILQIGELVSVLSDGFKQAHAGVPWREIKQMRNIVAHKYGNFDSSIAWDVVMEDVPALLEFCKANLE